MPTVEQVRETAAELLAYATHFAPQDWNYSRRLGKLKEIRYSYTEDRLPARLWRAVAALMQPRRASWPTLSRGRMALLTLERDRHMPDGMLDDGAIITFWEETGEYLQYVQPSVGALLAEWLAIEPEHPHAQKIAAEMRRIQDAYSKRLAREHGEVTDH